MSHPNPPWRAARRARAVLAALLLLLLGALAAGCARRDVLARIGDRVVTRADFEAIAKDNASQYPGEPDSAKKQMLDDMVRRELMLVAAHRLGFDRDSTLLAGQRVAQDDLLARVLYQALVPNDVPVSDAEAAVLHRWRGTRSHVFVIYTRVRPWADSALAALRRGAPWAEVFARYSSAGVVPNGGDLGWTLPGQLIDPLDQTARLAPVGTAQGPLQAPTEGWFVALVAARQPNPTGSFESERPYLADMLRQRKQRTIALEAFQSLREQYQVRLDPRATQVLYGYANLPRDSVTGAPRGAIDLHAVLATYDGGPGASGDYTLGDAVRDLADPQRDRPSFNSSNELEAWIDAQVLQKVAAIEARRRHLDEEPDVARRLRALVDNQVLQRIYRVSVASVDAVSDPELQAYYAMRAPMFARRDSVTGRLLPPPELASLPAPMQANLRMEALAAKRDVRLRAYTDSVRATVTPFEEHPERLAGIVWPAPPAMFPGLPPGLPTGHP